MSYFGFDWTYLLALAGLGLTMLAQAGVTKAFRQYYDVMSSSGLSGAQAARRVLDAFGINDVKIEHIAGDLTDHYDPRSKVLRLSDATYASRSVAAVSVAAHECGHADQHQRHYGPLVLRSTLVPAASIGSKAAWPIFFLGLITAIRPLTMAGILLFAVAVLFQLVTLPVEFDASARALRALDSSGIVTPSEMPGAKKVLRAAALTYVASLASSLLQLARLVLLSGRRSRD